MSCSATFDTRPEADEYLDRVAGRNPLTADPLITLEQYAATIGDRYLRGVDPTSTGSGYRGLLRRRVLPTSATSA